MILKIEYLIKIYIKNLILIMKIKKSILIQKKFKKKYPDIEVNRLTSWQNCNISTVNFENNTISGLLRGANGTGIQPIIPKYVEVFGILSENIMSMTSYDETWNSDIYNLTDGDPLQISVTTPAEFIRSIP